MTPGSVERTRRRTAGGGETAVFLAMTAILVIATTLGIASQRFWELGLVALVITLISFAGARGTIASAFGGASRGGRSRSTRALAAQLQQYAQTDQDARVIATLRGALPDWPIRASLISAALELQELRRSAKIAQVAGVSDAITIGLTREAETASVALWPNAERVAAVAAQAVSSPAVSERLEREVAKLDRLVVAARQAREGLALATLHDGRDVDLEVALEGLRLAAGQAQEYGA